MGPTCTALSPRFKIKPNSTVFGATFEAF